MRRLMAALVRDLRQEGQAAVGADPERGVARVGAAAQRVELVRVLVAVGDNEDIPRHRQADRSDSMGLERRT